MRALAFTVGQDIHFAPGQYDPISPAQRRLLAHEVAHTAQLGSRTAGVQVEPRISSRGEAPEREADLAAIAMVRGAPAAVRPSGGTLPQVLLMPQQGSVLLGGEEIRGPALPNQQGTGVVRVGEQTYGRQLLRITAEAAGRIGDLPEVQGLLLHPVVPDLSGLEAAIAQRDKDFHVMKAWGDDESGFFGHHQSAVQAHVAQSWVEGHRRVLTRDRDEESAKFQAFNAWVPQANAFYASLSRLQAQMNLLGFGADLSGMVQALLREIGAPAQEAQPAEGEGIAQPAQAATGAAAVAARAIDRGATLPLPPTDNTVTEAGVKCSLAFQRMQTAYLGLQQNIHKQRIQEINVEGDEVRAHLQEINEVKQFIHQVGSTIDLTAGVINGAPAAISNATDLMNRTGAQYSALRNRRAILRGEVPRWNPTYTTVDSEGKMVIRNAQTGMDLDPTIVPGEPGRQRPSPGSEREGGFPKIPTGIGGALDLIADFAYREEVLKLNQQLASIESQCTAESVAKEFLETTQKARAYRDALNEYAAHAAHFQQRLAERRRQYFDFGEALDRSAAGGSGRTSSGGPVGRGRDRFATVMVLASQIRETIAVGGTALQSDTLGDRSGLQGWFDVLEGHRTDPGHPPLTGYGRQSEIQPIPFPDAERSAIREMANQSLTFRARAGNMVLQLAPVDQAVARMMASLHPGGGSQGY